MDLPADRVLILVERAFVRLRDMPAVERSVKPLLPANRAVVAMEPRRFACGDLSGRAIVVDAGVLPREAVVDLGAPRMVLLPCARQRSSGGAGDECGNQKCQSDVAQSVHDPVLS